MSAMRMAVRVLFVAFASMACTLATAQDLAQRLTASVQQADPTEHRVVVSDEQVAYASRVPSDDDYLRAWGETISDSDLPSPAPEYRQSALPSVAERRHDVHHECCTPPREQHRFPAWLGAEYLLWRLDGSRLPPLVTDGPATTPLADVAQLDDPDTRILSGNETVNNGWRSGYRFFGGFWFDHCHTCGIGADYFDIGNDDYGFVSLQDPTRVVGRPFFNTEIGENDVQLIFVPIELDGTVEVRSNDGLQGAGVTFHQSLWRCCDPCSSGFGSGVWLLSGYRYYKYDSRLSITEQLTVLPDTTSPLVPGTTFFVQDSFRTHNEFHGSEIGFQAHMLRRGWWLDGTAKVALGRHRRSVTVDGQTIVDVPGGGTATAAGGLLTSEITNIGRYENSDFVLIPEFRLGGGLKLNRNLLVRAGYSLIYWGDVARAASHLPPGLAVDPRNLPPILPGGGPEPEFPGIRGTQLVAHGFDASIIWQW